MTKIMSGHHISDIMGSVLDGRLCCYTWFVLIEYIFMYFSHCEQKGVGNPLEIVVCCIKLGLIHVHSF